MGGCWFDWSTGVRADVGSYGMFVLFGLVWCRMEFCVIAGTACDVDGAGQLGWHGWDEALTRCEC